MKVYVITKGSYSDYHICGVSLDRDKAMNIAKLHSSSGEFASVEEYDTDLSEKINNGYKPYFVDFDKNGDVTTANETAFDYFSEDLIEAVDKSRIRICLFAKDEAAAIKIAAEKRAMYLAAKLNLN